jgi:6-phospho-beta-glucosidase
VQYFISRYTGVNAIGLCDGPLTLRQHVAQVAELAPEEVWIDYVGMHHFGWAVGAWQDERNILPQVLKHAELTSPEVDPAINRAIGAVPEPYLNYIFHPDKMLAKKMGKRTRAEELLELQNELLAEFETALAAGEKPAGLLRRKACWYQDIIAPVMMSLAEKTTATLTINMVNGTILPWLPSEAIIEVPALIECGRIHPLTVSASILTEVKALVQVNCIYEMLAVETIVERDRTKVLKALLLNPIIRTHEQAVQTLEKAWM